MCSEIGMPREARELMMEELEAVLAAGNDETLRKQTEQILGDGLREMMVVPIREESVEIAWALVTEAKVEEEHPGQEYVRDEDYWRKLVNNNLKTTEESYAACEDNWDAW